MREIMLVVHIPALVMWVGGLLMVTLILAYHTVQASAEVKKALADVEKKLLVSVVHPGAALVVISGLVLLLQIPGVYMTMGWMHAKLGLVVLLILLDLRIHFRTKAFHAARIQMQRGEAIGLQIATALIFLGIVGMVFVRPL